MQRFQLASLVYISSSSTFTLTSDKLLVLLVVCFLVARSDWLFIYFLSDGIQYRLQTKKQFIHTTCASLVGRPAKQANCTSYLNAKPPSPRSSATSTVNGN